MADDADSRDPKPGEELLSGAAALGEHLAELIDQIPLAVYVCEAPSGAIRLFNRRAAELWGRQPRLGDNDERFCGAARLYRLDGSPLPRTETPMAQVLADGQPRADEVVIERPDGSRVTVHVDIRPLRDAQGGLWGAVNAFRDVTAIRVAEEALRQSEARHRAILEHQTEMVCRFLPDGTMTFANQAYLQYFALRTEDIIGKTYAPVVHPDDLPQVQAKVATLSPAHPMVTIENRVQRGDGAIRLTQWSNHGVYDQAGRLIELQSTGRDVTEERRATQALEASVQRLEALYRLVDAVGRAGSRDEVCAAAIEAILAAAGCDRASVLVFDDAGVMRFVAWHGLSETYRRAVDGHSPWTADTVDPVPIVVEDAAADRELAGLREVILAEGIRALGFVPLLFQGRLLGKFMLYFDRPHAFSAEELRLAATIGQHVGFGLARVTAEGEIAALLERERAARAEADLARAAAVRANRAKDEFLAMLAHELRNPLAVVVNAISIIEAGTLDPAADGAAKMIRRQAAHLGRLLDDLLDVARITSGRIVVQREPLDLRATVTQGVEAQRHLIDQKRQRLAVSLPDDPVPVRGDAVRLQQVLGNLLNNAAKYTPVEGSIAVRLAAEGAEAVLSVRDDGTGIAGDQLEAIFDLFVQASPTLARNEGGLGIGLTLARRVAELHGGTLRARSEGTGRGAELTVRLPLISRVELPAEERPTPAAVLPRRILLIEDHDDGREALATLLGMYGHQVQQAGTGSEGLAAAERDRPDVVLVDIGLPDIEGYEVGARLRQKLGGTVQLLALTGYGQEADRRRSQQAGFDGHLVKPVEPRRLLDALDRPPQRPPD